MSSVIVLDSSDEDEAPPKKMRLSRDISATVNPIRLNKNAKPKPAHQQSSGAPTSKARKSPISQTQLNTATLQNAVKRKTPTPPQRNLVTPPGAQHSNNAGLVISNVTSMAPSATPPLQLLATPPHTVNSNADPLMISPLLSIQTSLPKSTTLTSITSNFPNRSQMAKRPSATSTASSPASSPLTSPNVPYPTKIIDSIIRPERGAVRRIQPTTILRNSDEAWLQRPKSHLSFDVDKDINTPSGSPKNSITLSPNSVNTSTSSPSQSSPIELMSPSTSKQAQIATDDRRTPDMITPMNGSEKVEAIDATSDGASQNNGQIADETDRPPLEPDYEEFLKACRAADPSIDMEKLISKKLIKYYYSVHPDFVRSRGFRKSLIAVTEHIKSEPDLVYNHLKTIVDELDVRRKNRSVVMNSEEASGSTGNKRTDEQIKKLNKALYILSKRIEKLEEAEVDLEDDDSSYLQLERFKKRACQIYDKICDLTGETRDAQRLVRKPIKFNGTEFPQFNKTLQSYINRTKEFPDYYDVLRTLEHCNRKYNFGLANFEVKRIAQDAFIKVGKLLQSRRKTDLYETVTHFTGNAKDPATVDPVLSAKLGENQKLCKKISEIIEKYAREQDLPPEEQKVTPEEEGAEASTTAKASDAPASSDDDDDDDDDEDKDKDNLDDEVEKFANGHISDADIESDIEAVGGDSSSATPVGATAEIVMTGDSVKNNNNTIMEKTDIDLIEKEPFEKAKDEIIEKDLMPNGKLKNVNNETAECSLRIISVSTLNKSVINKSSSSMASSATIVAKAKQIKQSTVAEIIISDEEDS